ncbi:contractile injection system tape measure protein [Serratia odorifera]|nr:contractile injection system tape measure protein [Serratia odorifera]
MDRVSLSFPLPAVLRDGATAAAGAGEETEGVPSVTGGKGRVTLPVESVAEQWFGALHQTALPAALRGPLRAWLCEPSQARERGAILADVSVSVHRQLRATLGLPLLGQHKTEAPVTPGANDRHRPVTDGDEDDVPRPLTNAGLVLLWPLLPRLFSTFGWLEEGLFIDEQARGHAIGCLDWLAWGDPDLAQWRTPCTALLCGLDLDTPHEACLPSLSRQADLDAWLGGALATVPLLARCGASDLRTFFLQRTGTFDNASRRLVIEPEAPDVLLHQLPWPLTPVVLPWLPAPLCVDWIS